MNCDRCHNETEPGQERKIQLVGTDKNYTFTLCSNCKDEIQDPGRIDGLCRNTGIKEIQRVADQMSERGEDNQPKQRREAKLLSRGTKFDEGRYDTEWLKLHGYLARVRVPGEK